MPGRDDAWKEGVNHVNAAQLKVGDEVIATVYVGGMSMRVKAKVTLIHKNGTLRVDVVDRRGFRHRNECRSWEPLAVGNTEDHLP
jgi:hypothetical protein